MGLGAAAHLWTLAIEEQFYLVWPFLMMLLPLRLVRPAIIAVVAGAVFTRAGLVLAGAPPFFISTFTFSNFDTLAAGALLGYSSIADDRPPRYLGGQVLLPLAVPLFVLCLWLPHDSATAVIFRDLASAGLFVVLISRAATGFGGVLGRLLESLSLRFLGAISYGLYVYHFFVPAKLAFVQARAGLGPWTFHLLCLLVTISIATLSFYLFEGPINRLKHRFGVSTQRSDLRVGPAVA